MVVPKKVKRTKIGFKKLSNKIEKSYEKKGVPKEEAERIAKATAYKIGVKRFGKKKMVQKAIQGKKKGGK